MNLSALRNLTVGNSIGGHMSMEEVTRLTSDLSSRGLDEVTNTTAIDGEVMVAYDHVNNIFLNNRLVRYVYCEGNDPRSNTNATAVIAKQSDAIIETVLPRRRLTQRTVQERFIFSSRESLDDLTVVLKTPSGETVRYFTCYTSSIRVTGQENTFAHYYHNYLEVGYHYAGRNGNLVVPDGFDESQIPNPDYEEVRNDLARINGYHWGHGFRIFKTVMFAEGESNTNQPTYGVEIETNNNGTSAQINAVDFTDAMWHLEHDGSISGYEMISRPLTWKCWVEKYSQIVNMFRAMTRAGVTGHNAGSGYGYHIHIGRQSFINDDAVLFFIGMMSAFRVPLQKLARREPTNYWFWFEDDWANTFVAARNHFMSNGHLRRNLGSRYYVVNPQNENTIEIRMFRSTLNPSTFMATLEIINNMVLKANELSANHTIPEVTWRSLCGGRFELQTREGNVQFPLDLDTFDVVFNVEAFLTSPEVLAFRRRKADLLSSIRELNADPIAESEGGIELASEDEDEEEGGNN